MKAHGNLPTAVSALSQPEWRMAAQKPKRGPVMRTETKMSEDRRQKMLREMLDRLRDETPYQQVG